MYFYTDSGDYRPPQKSDKKQINHAIPLFFTAIPQTQIPDDWERIMPTPKRLQPYFDLEFIETSHIYWYYGGFRS